LTVAVSVHNFFQNPRNIETIERLKAAGVKMEIDGDDSADFGRKFQWQNIRFKPDASNNSRATKPPN
jgi:hypothetical protein